MMDTEYFDYLRRCEVMDAVRSQSSLSGTTLSGTTVSGSTTSSLHEQSGVWLGGFNTDGTMHKTEAPQAALGPTPELPRLKIPSLPPLRPAPQAPTAPMAPPGAWARCDVSHTVGLPPQERYLSFGQCYLQLDAVYSEAQKHVLDSLPAIERAIMLQFQLLGPGPAVYDFLRAHGVSIDFASKVYYTRCKDMGIWHVRDDHALTDAIVSDESERLKRITKLMTEQFDTYDWPLELVRQRYIAWLSYHRFSNEC